MCGADHPDLPITCEYREDATRHEEHMGFHEGDLVEWPNEGYTVQKVSQGGRTNATKIAKIANGVHEREKGALSDPSEDNVGKMSSEPTDTSRAAAYAVMPKTGTQRWKVLDAILAAGLDGRTDEELQHALDMNPSSERPRRVELVEGGWIEDSTRRRTTPSGLKAIVWVLTEAGLSKLS